MNIWILVLWSWSALCVWLMNSLASWTVARENWSEEFLDHFVFLPLSLSILDSPYLDFFLSSLVHRVFCFSVFFDLLPLHFFYFHSAYCLSLCFCPCRSSNDSSSLFPLIQIFLLSSAFLLPFFLFSSSFLHLFFLFSFSVALRSPLLSSLYVAAAIFLRRSFWHRLSKQLISTCPRYMECAYVFFHTFYLLQFCHIQMHTHNAETERIYFKQPLLPIGSTAGASTPQRSLHAQITVWSSGF